MGAIDTHILRLRIEERLSQIIGVFVNCVGIASFYGGACSNVDKASDRVCSDQHCPKQCLYVDNA